MKNKDQHNQMRQTGLPVSIVVERSIKFRACDGRARSVLLRQGYEGVASLGTTGIAKKFNLPYFAKASKGL